MRRSGDKMADTSPINTFMNLFLFTKLRFLAIFKGVIQTDKKLII